MLPTVLPPDRPLPVDLAYAARRRHRTQWGALACVVAALGVAGAAALGAQELAEDVALWRRGTPGEVLGGATLVSQLEGRRGRRLLEEYTLLLDWRDAQGRTSRSRVQLTSVVALGPEAPTLRYDPREPTRVVTSWQLDWRVWLPTVLFTLVALLLVPTLLWAARQLHRQALAQRRMPEACEAAGEELWLPLVSLSPAAFEGTWRVEYVLPEGARHAETLRAQPLVVRAGGTAHVLALRAPAFPGLPLLVEEDLAPLLLSPDAAAEVRQRLAALGGTVKA